MLAFVPALFNRCSDQCEIKSSYTYFEPVYMTMEQVRAATGPEEPRVLATPGKIYFKDNYLFVNEVSKGIHVIDNRNPAAPLPISFIAIPGNYDLAILGNILYADSYTDLVAFDITQLADAREVGRHANLFKTYGSNHFNIDPVRGVITEWQKVEQATLQNECDLMVQPWGGYWLDNGFYLASDLAARGNSKTSIAPGGGGSVGIGGSMARFAINGAYLFALDGNTMDVVRITNPAAMEIRHEMNIAWDIETIFPYEDKMFIGSRTGMYILDVSNPELPQQLSVFAHMRSCDPVVVDGDLAFVTLRDGNTCAGAVNVLQVIDISNLQSPSLIKSYNMTNPHGLGVDGDALFICDGNDGLKIFDRSDVLQITQNRLAHYQNLQAYDVIPFQNVAMMIGEDGLYQYDYSDLQNIRQISMLPIVKPAE